MKEMVRLRKFLVELNGWYDSNSYYDDDLEDVIIDRDENDCYRDIMQNDEFHLLGSDCVKRWIHMMYTDWNTYVKMCDTMKVY